MKSYAIYDEDLGGRLIGYLFYYEKSESFIIELSEELDEWEAPLLFQRLVREKKHTVPRDVSLMWGKERVIPSGRQNIVSILKNHKLKGYIAEIEVEKIPNNIKERMKKNLWECFPTEDNQLVCLFQDDVVKKVELMQLVKQYKDLSHVLKNRKLLDSVKIGVGGYSVVFDNFIEIQVYDLRAMGQSIPLSSGDFYNFARRNILDTTKTCDMLQCSRQNMSYLVKEKK